MDSLRHKTSMFYLGLCILFAESLKLSSDYQEKCHIKSVSVRCPQFIQIQSYILIRAQGSHKK